MAFRVEISPQAFEDLDSISAYIRDRGSFESAERWFNGIMAAIKTLRDRPQRCPLAEESQRLQAEIRLLLYGKRNRRYKIYFAVHKETETIRVFHVRHWARRPADTDELDDLMDDSAEPGGA
jgi:plasmid stabilization system protein ParE